MQNTRLAGRYSKSLLTLAIEDNKLEAITQEARSLLAVINGSKELRVLLKSPVIKPGKKESILTKIFSGKLSPLTEKFLILLVRKGREGNLPEILENYLEQYNELKGINHIKLTTAYPVAENTLNHILESIKKTTPLTNIEMETAIDESLIGGYVLELRDYLVDASIKRELALVKRQFTSNDYTYNIR